MFLAACKKGCPITWCFQDVIEDWWNKVGPLHLQWAREVIADAPEGAGDKYYLPHFHRFALQGVLDVLEVLHKHWDGKIGWQSWSGPE